MATHRTWRVELAGQKHSVEWEQTGTERVRILVDEQPVMDEKPRVPAPRYEFTVAGHPALLHIPQESISQEYELEVAGQNRGRGVPASAREIAESERRVLETGAAEDRLRARLLGLLLVVTGGVMTAMTSYTLEAQGRYRPIAIVLAAAAIPTGLAMMVLGEWEPGASEDEDEDTRSIPWRTKVVMALGTAGAIVGMGMAFGLQW